MVETFKASAFSIECNINAEKAETQISTKGNLQLMVVFLLNKDMPGRFVENFTSQKVVMNESNLIGHIGKEVFF